jgi:hypothetical protein
MLLTKANRKALPALYTQDGKGDDAIAHVKFFTPDAGATWYATEFDGDDTFFGYCDLGLGFPELGYFSLTELQSVRGKFGLPVERDRYYSPTTLATIKGEGA